MGGEVDLKFLEEFVLKSTLTLLASVLLGIGAFLEPDQGPETSKLFKWDRSC